MLPTSIKCKCGLKVSLEVKKSGVVNKSYYFSDELYLKLDNTDLLLSKESLRNRDVQRLVSHHDFIYDCSYCNLHISASPTYLGVGFRIIIIDSVNYIELYNSIHSNEFITLWIDNGYDDPKEFELEKITLFELDKVFKKLDNILYLG